MFGSIYSAAVTPAQFFLMAAADQPFDDVKAYFQSKGLNTIFKYQDLIL